MHQYAFGIKLSYLCQEMNVTIASMTYSAVSSVLIKQTSPSSFITSAKPELEELHLDDGADILSRSRPIGMSNKRYRSFDGGSGRSAESKQNVEFYLTNRHMMLQPGHNKVILSGKVCKIVLLRNNKYSFICFQCPGICCRTVFSNKN